MSVRVRRTVVIDRQIEELWPLVTDLDSEQRWRAPWVRTLTQLDDEPLGAGTRIRGTTRIAGSTDTYVNEVTEYAPPRRYAWEGVEASGPVTSAGVYELEPAEDGRTRVTIEITYRGTSLLGRLQLPVVRLVASRIIDRMLGQLEDLATGAVPRRSKGV